MVFEISIWNLKHPCVSYKNMFVLGIQLESEKAERQIKKKDVDLSIESAQVFKPGFPLSIRIKAKRPDGGPADVDATLKV